MHRMTTRSKTTARQEESKADILKKLDLTLAELKNSKGLIEQLHKEREDNEKELLEALEKNSYLKKELAELHNDYVLVVDERNRFQTIIDGFGQCSEEYVQGLRRVSIVEQELREAHQQISELQSVITEAQATQTQSLFQELVSSGPSVVTVSTAVNSDPIVSEDSTPVENSHFKGIVKCSKNKFKKYVKINKYIRKTNKLIKKQKSMYTKVKYIKERRQLGDELDMYSLLLEKNIKSHENEICTLEKQLFNLSNSLQLMTSKYTSTKKECEEHMLALKELLSYGCQNCKKITNSPIRSRPTCESTDTQQLDQSIVVNHNSSLTQSDSIDGILTLCDPTTKYVMFSDEFGKDMGQLLSNHLGQTVTNYCMPGLTYCEIMEKIIDSRFDDSTTLLIFVGDRGKLSKSNLIKYFEKLKSLNVKNIVMFNLPYCCNLSQAENNIRYKINLTLDTLTFNCNNFHIIDINTYLENKFYVSNDSYYLSRYIKRQIVISLSYFIIYTAKNLANQPAPIEQAIDILTCSQPLESVPNHLN